MLFAILVRRLVLLLVAVVCTFVKFCSQCLFAVLFADVQFCWYKLFAMSAVLFADVHLFAAAVRNVCLQFCSADIQFTNAVRNCCSQCLFADVQFCWQRLFAHFVCRCSVLLAAAVRNVAVLFADVQFCWHKLFAMFVCSFCSFQFCWY